MRRTLSLLVSLTLISTAASATTILFTDRSSFLLATGATSVGAIPFSSSSADFTVGILTFENESPSSVNHDRNWSTLISEPFDLAINGVEDFNVVSSSSLYSFGFDFHEPSTSRPPGPIFPDTCNTTCVDSFFEITILNGSTVVATHPFSATDDTLAFVGVWSSDPFDRVEIRETTGTNDNEFFGNFVTGDRPLPEPTTLTLVGVGLLGLAIRRRRA